MLLQHQSVVGSLGLLNLWFPQFQHCCLLSMELTPFWHSHFVRHHIHFVLFLKPTVLTRPSVPPSGSNKCLRFGLWPTLCTLQDFILTYLLVNVLGFSKELSSVSLLLFNFSDVLCKLNKQTLQTSFCLTLVKFCTLSLL